VEKSMVGSNKKFLFIGSSELWIIYNLTSFYLLLKVLKSALFLLPKIKKGLSL